MRKLLLRRRNFEVTQACQIFGITQQELEPFLVSGDGSRGRQFFFPEAMTSEWILSPRRCPDSRLILEFIWIENDACLPHAKVGFGRLASVALPEGIRLSVEYLDPPPGWGAPKGNPRMPQSSIPWHPFITTCCCRVGVLPRASWIARPVRPLIKECSGPVWPTPESRLFSLNCQVSLPLAIF